MSKITNDGLTQSGTGCLIAVPIWQQWVGVKGLNECLFRAWSFTGKTISPVEKSCSSYRQKFPVADLKH